MSSIRRDQWVKNLFSTTDFVKCDLTEELWHFDSTGWFLEVEAHLAEQQQKILPWWWSTTCRDQEGESWWSCEGWWWNQRQGESVIFKKEAGRWANYVKSAHSRHTITADTQRCCDIAARCRWLLSLGYRFKSPTVAQSYTEQRHRPVPPCRRSPYTPPPLRLRPSFITTSEYRRGLSDPLMPGLRLRYRTVRLNKDGTEPHTVTEEHESTKGKRKETNCRWENEHKVSLSELELELHVFNSLFNI